MIKDILDIIYNYCDIDSMFVFDDIDNCIDISGDLINIIPLFYFLMKIE